MLQPLIASFAIVLIFGAAVCAQGGSLPRAALEDTELQDDGLSPRGSHSCVSKEHLTSARGGCENEHS